MRSVSDSSSAVLREDRSPPASAPRHRQWEPLARATRSVVLELLENRRLFDGGDFSLDFIAAAPFTYHHSTGGGAYDDRTIGKENDVVESLEGGDFAAGDIVTYFVAITVDAGATGVQTI